MQRNAEPEDGLAPRAPGSVRGLQDRAKLCPSTQEWHFEKPPGRRRFHPTRSAAARINDGSFLRAPPHQGRIGVELFEVAAYRNDIGNRCTAIEFEYRNRAIRIQGAECRGE